MKLEHKRPIKIFLFLAIFIFAISNTSLKAHNRGFRINPIEFHESKLERLVLKKINRLREKYDAQPLIPNASLEEAASSQIGEMQRFNRISHTQISSFKKATLSQRMKYFKAPFSYFGENLASIKLGIQLKTNFTDKIITINTYKEAANVLVSSWQNSQGHFRNLIDPEFKYTGLKIGYNTKRKTIYAAQVFGG